MSIKVTDDMIKADKGLLMDLFFECVGIIVNKNGLGWSDPFPFSENPIVSLVIDGIEVPIRPVVDEWESQMDDMIKQRAAKMVRERVTDEFEAMEGVLRIQRVAAIDIANKLSELAGWPTEHTYR